ncbi:MAG: beta-lactamase hydrolase domain-containing protein [Acinetobacter sp.]
MIKHVIYRAVLSLSLACSTQIFAETTTLMQSLNPSVSVAGQMTTEKFRTLVDQGFKSVIVNRPDQEQGNHVSVAQLRQIAEKSQVSVIYQPIISGKISKPDVVEFAKYYNELPKPILMICRSGSRSSLLFNEAKKLGLLNE